MIIEQLIYVRGVIIAIGLIGALYKMFDIKITSKSIFDVGLMLSFQLLIVHFNLLLDAKTIGTLIVVVMIVVQNHKIKLFSVSLFSGVLVFMLTVSGLLTRGALIVSPVFRNAVSNPTTVLDLILFTSFTPLIIVLTYYLGVYIVKKFIDVFDEKLAILYLSSSVFFILIILYEAHLISYIKTTFQPLISVEETMKIMFATYIPFILIIITSLVILRYIYLNEKNMEQIEIEIEKLEVDRVNVHRKAHNFNNIMISINYLAKDENKEELKNYLEGL